MDPLQEKLAMAARHQAEGRPAQAERLYLEVLEERPDSAEAMHLLGVLRLQQGDTGQAVDLVGRACTARPRDPAMLNSLGMAYRRGGQLEQAQACYRRALALDPDAPAAHVNMGELLATQGDLEQAERAFRRALELDAEHAQALGNLAQIRLGAGQPGEALELYRRAERAAPDDWQIKSNLGLLLLSMGQTAEAEQSLRRALLLDPGNPILSLNLATVLLAAGDAAGAEKLCREAAAVAPADPLARLHLGRALLALGKQAEAVLTLVKAASLSPEAALAHRLLGDALRREGNLKGALKSYSRALELDPIDSAASLGQADCLLLGGELERGFEVRAARRAIPSVRAALPPISQPRWDGSKLAGETVLLHGDHGLSETLLLLRYLPRARERGAKVLLACPAPLERLVRASDLADELLLPGGDAPEYDLHAALDDLPRLLGAAPAALPPPYLKPPEKLTARWQAYLGGEQRLTVGFLWKGEGTPGDPNEVIPLDAWQDAWAVPNTRWASLQYGLTEQELSRLEAEPRVGDLAARVGDLADAVAAAAALDLVITADTAVAHLAGAAGIEAWVLLPPGPAWCWGMEAERCPWYPSLRLLRRQGAGGWEGMMERVVEELRRRVEATG